MGELAVIVLVFVAGLVAMFLELLLPGAVMGMLGFLAVSGSIIYALVSGYKLTGVIFIMVTLAAVPVFFFAWKGIIGRLFSLEGSEEGFASSSKVTDSLLGAEGETVSPLRPSGIARINDTRHDVVTRGEMLDKGVRIKVIEVSGNRLVVKRI